MRIPDLPAPPDRRVVDGLAAVDRYAESGDVADLSRAVRAFTEGYRVAPDGPDRLVCLHWLSRTCAESAEVHRRVVDYDRAIDWTHRLLALLDSGDWDRDDAVIRLVDLYWDRWLALCQDTGSAPDAEVERLVAIIAAQSVSDADPTAAHYLRLMYGLALHAQVGAGLAGDLDGVVDVLARALSALSQPVAEDGTHVGEWAGDGRLALGSLALADAYGRRGHRDGDMADLDRAVALLRAAVAQYGAEPELRAPLCRGLAYAHDQRWRFRADGGPEGAEDATADLAAAIAACAAAGSGDEPWFDAFHGELLGVRAEAAEDPVDARAAADLLEGAAEATAGEPDNWVVRHSAAMAYRLLWRLTGTLPALERAADHLDEVLVRAVVDGGQLLQIHTDRLVVERELIEVGLERRSEGGPSVMRGLVADAHRALDTAVRADPDQRAEFAGLLAFAELTATRVDAGELDMARIRGLLALARTARDAGPDWPLWLDGLLGWLDVVGDVRDPSANPDGSAGGGAARLARLGVLADRDSGFARDLRMAVGLANHLRATGTGDRRRYRIGRRQVDPDGSAEAAGEQFADVTADERAMKVYLQVLERLQAGDGAGAGAIAREALPAFEGAASSTFDEGFLAILRAVSVVGDPLASVPLTMPDVPSGEGIDAVAGIAAGVMTAGAMLAQGAARGDLALLREATGQLEALIERIPAADRRLACGALGLAAFAHLELARRNPGIDQHARTAARLGERAMGLARGPHFPVWSRLALTTAEAVRLTVDPDLPHTRELGVSALRGHAWAVFSQAGTDDAIASARAAAADARVVIRWCLADRLDDPGADEHLVAALDGGRGLVLRATTTSRTVADQLAARNRPDLAARWRAAADQDEELSAATAIAGLGGGVEVPDELRLRVLHVLGGERVVGYEPVTTTDIRTALGGVGFDALAYLVAGEHGLPGAAVVVPAAGRPTVLDLPRLHLGPQSPVRRYLATQGTARNVSTCDAPGRERGPADRDLGPVEWLTTARTGQDDLCAWAWEAAMRELLSVAEDWGLRRRLRLVLVPMGALGLVPWHAAVDVVHGHRYAVQDAVISYSPSARAFCEIDPADPAPITSALVVGDPTGDLPYAGAEARAVHRVFYPDGALLNGTGTPEDVLDWMVTRPPGPAALHFACHGSVDPRYPADAHLILADRAPLAVRGLLERARSAPLDVEQVFLAACTTGVSGDDHDEVLSLATSFRAAGARTVYGSLWPVPDGDTSLLMFLVHRFLRVDGCPPVDALHRAQLWMLDPQREIHDAIPEELLVPHRPGTPFGLASWAGFTHTGR